MVKRTGSMWELLQPLKGRAYRNLWFAQFLSEAGDWLARLALGVLVFERTGSALYTGLAIGASLATWLGPGQVLASRVDRFGRRNVMLGADLVRGAAFLLMLLPVPLWALVALAAAAGLVTPAFEGARSAAVIEVVEPEMYGSAIAFSGITQDVSLLVGYLLGGAALFVADPMDALGLNALTFFASAALVATLPPLEHTRESGAAHGLGAAFTFLRQDPIVRRAVLLALAATFSAATAETLIVVFNGEELSGERWVPGLLLAGTALVTIVGTTLTPLKGSPGKLLAVAAKLCTAAALIVMLLAPLGVPSALVAFLVVGVLFVVPIPTNVVAGPRIPSGLRVVALSMVVGAMVGGEAVAAVLAGLVAEGVGSTWALALSMLPAAGIGIYTLCRPYRDETQES